MKEDLLVSNCISYGKEFLESGFTTIDEIYTEREIENIADAISLADSTSSSFLKNRRSLRNPAGSKRDSAD